MCDGSRSSADKSGGDATERSPEASALPKGLRIPLTRDLSSKEIERRLIQLLRSRDAYNRGLSFYFTLFHERREHRLRGYATAVRYAEARLGLDEREARELLRVGRKLEGLPLLDEAFCRGEINWTKLRELTRVAVAETEREWLLYARGKTSRETQRAVSGREEGDLPPKDGEERLGLRRLKFPVTLRLSVGAKNAWETLMDKLHAERPDLRSTDEIVRYMAETLIRTDPEGKVPGRKERKEPPYAITYHADAKGRSWVELRDGALEVPFSEILEAEEKARVIEVKDLEEGAGDAILFGERGVVPPGERAPPASASLRRAVSARDGDRCTICRRGDALFTHHLDSRGKGGETRMEVLLTLCATCHTNVHEGVTRVTVGPEGRLALTDMKGNPLAREITPAEALPPEDLAIIDRVEPMEPELQLPDDPPRVVSATEVVSGPDPSMEERITNAQADVGVPASDSEGEPETRDDPPRVISPSQVLSPSRSAESVRPLSGVVQVVRARTLLDLPSALTPEGWRALSGRLEWSTRRRGFLFHSEWAAAMGAQSSPRRAPSFTEEADRHRPLTLSDLIGQERAVSNLALAVRAARERGDVLPHVLLTGPPGVGKTTMAQALAREMGCRIHLAVGNLLPDPSHVLPLLSGLATGDFLFIDEVHCLPRASSECLHTALEDRASDIQVFDGSSSKMIRLLLAPFTLVGATMEPGRLTEAFRSRFKIDEALTLYPRSALEQIARRTADRLGLSVGESAALEIARRARGTPRGTIRLVEWARDIAQVRGSPTLDREHVLEASLRWRIDAHGLREEERSILDLLIEKKRPMGIQALSATLRLDLEAVIRVHEPFLLAEGLIQRTARGREVTAKGRKLRRSARDEEAA